MAAEDKIKHSGSDPDHHQGTSEQTDVLRQNITAGKLVSDIVKSTLGPYGRDILFYDREDYEEDNYFEVTNSGAFVLKRLAFEQPAAGVVARIAKTQDEQCGDGTTTTALYAGQILAETEELIEQGVHPNTAARGVNEAVELAGRAIENISDPIAGDMALVESVVRTTLSGQLADTLAPDLCEWIGDAVEASDGAARLSKQSVQTESLRAGNIRESEFVNGFVLKSSFAGHYDPQEITDPRIGLTMQGLARSERIQQKLETGNNGTRELVYDSSDPSSYDAFTEYERELLREQLAGVVEADVDVMIVSNRVEEDLVPFFDKHEIAVIRESDRGRLKSIAEATGATANNHVKTFSSDDVGHADRLEQQSYPEIEQNALFLRGCPEGHVASALAHGSTWASCWEAERNINNAVAVAGTAIEDGQVVPGGGATEMEICRSLRDAAIERGGKESLVINAVADAFQAVPRTLAQNAGMDPLDTIVALRTAHHDGGTDVGVLPAERTTGHVSDRGVYELAYNKRSAVQAAGSVVSTILRIDDIVTSDNPGI